MSRKVVIADHREEGFELEKRAFASEQRPHSMALLSDRTISAFIRRSVRKPGICSIRLFLKR
ncbi:MAG: hypothetical protein A2X05_10090 [Bacteroidetes bacterium GWE2_41_25]|nr:MAG: hypothetical protein A2X03_18150 [Bacteroidetes bacterium GWA2_40_15]OFX86089.1 MAG: hypothetical protein A2X06_16510 [Bacteroidetes bacterium GWC2_40_22]OFY12717.1 MAG: hypothetical protein A2X05_10090 [Bacteroidetes bacterium GWE2_41_25]OFY61705.1 MAG: hypothetical protein A2X04_11690 [Bacteroidetes bacterium GWF2_41_9]